HFGEEDTVLPTKSWPFLGEKWVQEIAPSGDGETPGATHARPLAPARAARPKARQPGAPRPIRAAPALSIHPSTDRAVLPAAPAAHRRGRARATGNRRERAPRVWARGAAGRRGPAGGLPLRRSCCPGQGGRAAAGSALARLLGSVGLACYEASHQPTSPRAL